MFGISDCLEFPPAYLIYIDIVPDVPDTSGESKNNIVAAFGGPKMLYSNKLILLSTGVPCKYGKHYCYYKFIINNILL